jgi:hypothetical protein
MQHPKCIKKLAETVEEINLVHQDISEEERKDSATTTDLDFVKHHKFTVHDLQFTVVILV